MGEKITNFFIAVTETSTVFLNQLPHLFINKKKCLKKVIYNTFFLQNIIGKMLMIVYEFFRIFMWTNYFNTIIFLFHRIYFNRDLRTTSETRRDGRNKSIHLVVPHSFQDLIRDPPPRPLAFRRWVHWLQNQYVLYFIHVYAYI